MSRETSKTDASPPSAADGEAVLAEGLKRLAHEETNVPLRLGARLRNYFLTGIIIVGPVAVTVYLIKWFIEFADDYVKPLIPSMYLPETYLPFAIPASACCSGSSASPS